MAQEMPERQSVAKINRRKLIGALGTGVAAGIAGCGGGNQGDAEDGGGGTPVGGEGVPQSIERQYWVDWEDSRQEYDLRYNMVAEPGKQVEPMPTAFSREWAPWTAEWCSSMVRWLNELGIDSEVVNKPQDQLLAGAATRGQEYPFSTFVHGPDPQRGIDPDPLLGARRICGSAGNFYNYCNMEANELIDEERRTVDPDERQDVLDELQMTLVNDYHMSVPLANNVITVVNTEKWSGHVLTPGNGAALESFPWSEVNVQPETDDRTYVKGGGPALQRTNIGWVGSGAGGAAEKRLRARLYDGILDVSPSLEVVPALGTSVDIVDDTTIDVELRDGVQWHDGESFGPDDVKYTFETYIEYESPNQITAWQPLDTDNPVEILSESGGGTVRFNTDGPSATFPTVSLVRVTIFPKHIWDDVDDPTTFNPTGQEELVGTGAWKWNEWVTQESNSYTRWDNNWMWDESFREEVLGDQFESGPGAEELVYVSTGNVDSAVGACQAGEIDAVNSRLTGSQADEAADHPAVSKLVSENYAPLHCAGHWTFPIIRDEEWRKAFYAYGMNVDGFIEDVLNGEATKFQGNNPIFPGSPFFNEETPDFGYDPERSRQILSQAGYTWGGDDRLHYPDGDAWPAFVERVENPTQGREDLGQPDFS